MDVGISGCGDGWMWRWVDVVTGGCGDRCVELSEG